MPDWSPEKKWFNEDVFIIGGGDSLKGFDWNLLKPFLTVGCNDAYKLGVEICKVCIFGDFDWFEINEPSLQVYKGIVFSNTRKVRQAEIPWVWTTKREFAGLVDGTICWYANTGAMAINLALLLGAGKIYLLGFDMQLSKKGNSNWHPNTVDKPNKEVYEKFIKGFSLLVRDMKKCYPHVKVINVTDNSSLDLFLKIGVKEFWSTRK